jgi:hypothetical protein
VLPFEPSQKRQIRWLQPVTVVRRQQHRDSAALFEQSQNIWASLHFLVASDKVNLQALVGT